MEAIYISSCIPYNGKSGGRLASYNHLLKISTEYEMIHAFFVDVEYDAKDYKIENYPDNVKIKIFERDIKPVKDFYTTSLAIFRTLFTKFTRGMDAVYSKKMINEIREICNKNDNIIVILDHMDAFSNLYEFKDLKIIYIAHNKESDLSYQKIFFDNKIFFLFNFINFLKTKFFENLLIKTSIKNVFISDYDYSSFLKYKSKSIVYPEFIKLKDSIWNINNVKERSILFIGSATHYPNKEATLWLVNFFAPVIFDIDPSIKINICGITKESLGIYNDTLGNLKFLGRVSDEELNYQFLTNRVFLSPIILGSGIKMKVLEAASYCMPIFLTPESLRGLSFLDEILNTYSRQNLDLFVTEFLKFFNNNVKLCDQSDKLLKIAKKMELSDQQYFKPLT